MTARLIVEAPGKPRREVRLLSEVTTVGRASDCDIVLDYDYVSRVHMRIERTRDGYLVLDGSPNAPSLNGTFVNGRRITEMQMLVSGDRLALSDIAFTFQDGDSASIDSTRYKSISGECPIRCDPATRRVTIGDEALATTLSIQEFDLLSLLTSRFGLLCTRDELATAIWGRGQYDLNMLHRLVHRLKQKLGTHQHLIVSVAGVGYRIEADRT